MTANREYEALTTVEAVQKAFADGRPLEARWPPMHDWKLVTDFIGVEAVGALMGSGVEYRAPAASAGDAPSDAVAWTTATSLEMLRDPECGAGMMHAGRTDYINVPLYTAPPAAPVVSAGECRIDDLETALSVMIEWFDTVAGVAKWTRENANAAFMARDSCDETLNATGPYAALSVPATDDKAPAVDARYRMIAHLIGSIFYAGGFKAETLNEHKLDDLLRETGHRYASWDEVVAGHDALAAPTSPHDVDAVAWTDEQCVAFMAVALRPVVYSKRGDSPTCDDIRLGVTAALRKPGEA